MPMIKSSFFGETKLVKSDFHWKNRQLPEEEAKELVHEETLWVERGEDMYALMSPQCVNKIVAVVHRDDWLRAKDITN